MMMMMMKKKKIKLNGPNLHNSGQGKYDTFSSS